MIYIRAFIGIDFDSELKNNIFELQQMLRIYAIRGRWKHIDNFHLTLKFLDEVGLRQQERIGEAMKKICISRRPFSLAVSGIGIFEGRDSIRVLWLGLRGDILELKSLHESVESALIPIGFPYEKRTFHPHITLGQDIVFKCEFDEIQRIMGNVRFNSFKVNSLFLFKSDQVQNKRIYTKVSDYDFGIEKI